MRFKFKSKEAARRSALKEGRKVLWLCDETWRAAIDLRSTPWSALEIEELFPTLNYSEADWLKDKRKYLKANKNV